MKIKKTVGIALLGIIGLTSCTISKGSIPSVTPPSSSGVTSTSENASSSTVDSTSKHTSTSTTNTTTPSSSSSQVSTSESSSASSSTGTSIVPSQTTTPSSNPTTPSSIVVPSSSTESSSSTTPSSSSTTPSAIPSSSSSSVVNKYNVTFVYGNGTDDYSFAITEGDKITMPTEPTKLGYTFDGWLMNNTVYDFNSTVSTDVVLTAKWIQDEYTVKFVNDDSTVISSTTYHYGDTVVLPESNPTKSSDNTYTYEFDSWDKTVETVTGDTTYKATYTATYIDYTINFINYDDSIISTNTYHFGDTVVIPSSNPIKSADNTYTYTFNAWDSNVIEVDGNKTYKATYTSTYIDYTVTFINYDDTVISSETYHYSDTVVVPTNPTKASNETYSYAFNGWDNEVTEVNGNTTYKATFTSSYINYSIKFINDDNTEILVKNDYHYGDAIVQPATNPTKASDNTYTYEFKEWDSEIASTVTGNATYKATYTSTYIDYTVTFVNYDDSIILTNTYHYGDTVVVPATNPLKQANNTYTYSFAGWDNDVTTVTGNTTYKATFTESFIEYTIKFVNDDNTVISSNTYHYGDTDVVVPANPTKASDNTYTYEFKEWNKAIASVTESTTYKATYTNTYINYTIEFVDYDDTVISSVTTYHYGDTVTIPANPTRTADNTYTYAFNGWNNEVASNVNGHATYKATYTNTYIDYTVTFDTDGGSSISSINVHYEDTITKPANPTKEGHTFDKWYLGTDEFNFNTLITSNITLKASWNVKQYTVTFDSNGGSSVNSISVNYNNTITKPADPTLDGYKFSGWYLEEASFSFTTPITDNIKLKAHWIEDSIPTYTVTYVTNNHGTNQDQLTNVTNLPNTLPTLTEVGWTFEGWYLESNLSTKATAGSILSDNITLYAKWTQIEYTITFKNEDGTTITSVSTYHYGDTVTIPSNPTKISDNTYTYAFNGWDSTVSSTVVDNATYTATYTSTYIDYTVSFNTNGGSSITSKTCHYNEAITKPTDPTKLGYDFKGWFKDEGLNTSFSFESNITESITLYAKWDIVKNTVTFNTNEGSTIAPETVNYGNKVTKPTDPTKLGYEFKGWYLDSDLTDAYDFDSVVISTITLYAKWNKEVYTIKFVNDDNTVISTNSYYYGDTVVVPTNPTKSADNTYTYAFKEWNKTISIATESTTYTATYTSTYIDYTVKFVNYDNTEILVKTDYHYGDTVSLPESNPTKASDNTYNYTFKEWDNTITTVDGNKTYKATYNSSYIEYTITFTNYDDTEISSVTTYHYGDTITVPANPTRTADNTYTYAFNGWNNTVSSSVVGNATYKATYTSTYINYTVTFVDYNDTEISSVSTYHYSDTITVPANPTRTADNTYTYAFNGWNSTVSSTVNGNVTYKATYTSTYIEYTIKFVNEDNTVILSKTDYHYGDAVAEPTTNPTKSADNTYTYAFNGWNSTVSSTVVGNATYKATFTSSYINYTIEFVNDDNTVLLSKTDYHYGDVVAEPTNNPTKTSDNTYNYTFNGWNNTVTTVSRNATYKATYTPSYIDYTVKFMNGDTEVSSNTYHYGDTVTIPANPTKASDNTYNYTFKDWGKEITTVSGNTTYTAVFTSTYIEYTIKFVNEDNTEILVKTDYHYGDTVTVPANPTRTADNTYTYEFNKWDNTVSTVSGNTTYKATYTSTYINYTIKFVNEDNTEILVKTDYHYGDTVTQPSSNPTKSADNTYTYTFNGWDSTVSSTVAGNATYKATYTATYIDYTVTFNSNGGSTVNSISTHYNTKITKPTNPTKQGSSFYNWYTDEALQNEFSFDTNITSNITLYAKWTVDELTITFNTNGGSSVAAQTINYGGKATRPSTDPTKSGADFVDWYSDEACTTLFNFNTQLTQNTTIYAKWNSDIASEINTNLLAYVNNLITTTTSSSTPYKPAWNAEGFKDKWNYIDGVFLSSIVDLYGSTNDSTYKTFLTNYINYYINTSGQFVVASTQKTGSDAFKTGELDSICESKILFDAYQMTGDSRYLTAIETTYNALTSMGKATNGINYEHKSSYSKQVWLDGMYMYVPFYARYALMTNNTEIFNTIKLQYQFIRENMYDETKKLYYHGNDTSTSKIFWADETTGNSQSFWLRSMGWYIASLVDVLDYYPEGTNKEYLKGLLQEAMDGLMLYQDSSSKMFYQVIDKGPIPVTVPAKYLSGLKNTAYKTDSGYVDTEITNYLESSGSSIIAYVAMKGAKKGYISSSYLAKGMEIYEGIYSHSYNASTKKLNDICISAGLGGTDKTYRDGSIYYYLAEPVGSNDAKGTGPFIMAYIQYMTANTSQYSVTYSDPTDYLIEYTTKVDSGTIIREQIIKNSVKTGRTNYTFDGWYDDEALTIAHDFTKPVTKDTLLYAKWTDTSSPGATSITLNSYSGYTEGAYVEFDKVSGYSNATDYTVQYKANTDSSYTTVDSELTRFTDSAKTKLRCDIVGLKPGNYQIKITVGSLTKTCDVTVSEDDRSGYAFFANASSSNDATNGIGAYKTDGTLKTGAKVIYVTDDTKNTVKATVNGAERTGLVSILANAKQSSEFIDIRIIGKVSTTQFNTITYNKTNIKKKAIITEMANSLGGNYGSYTADQIIANGWNSYSNDTSKGITELKGLTSKVIYGTSGVHCSTKDSSSSDYYTSAFDTYWNMLDISGGQNITIEGIGTDAEIFQWGIEFKTCNSIEVKNLTFSDYTEDAVGFEGSSGDISKNGNYWVHNCTFNAGVNNWDLSDEQDKGDGDGSTDIKNVCNVTVSYTRYNHTHKTNLIGGNKDCKQYNITLHHNFYNEATQRLPLVRQANIHAYNNYYLGIKDSGSDLYQCGISIRSNAYAFIENSYFENMKTPIELRDDDSADSYKGNKYKSYNNTFDNCSASQTTSDNKRQYGYKENNVSSRTDLISSSCNPTGSQSLANFDTNSSVFYYDSVNQVSNVAIMTDTSDVKSYNTLHSGAGALEHKVDPTTINYCTVTYNTNGGTCSTTSQDVIEGRKLSSIPTPTKTGYTFGGWYTTNTFTTGSEFTTSTIVTANITVYAKWTAKQQYTVTFDSDGGSSVSNITAYDGDTITLPTNSTKTGYRFDGWMDNSTLVSNSYTISKNVTLKAKWTDISTITSYGFDHTNVSNLTATQLNSYDDGIVSLHISHNSASIKSLGSLGNGIYLGGKTSATNYIIIDLTNVTSATITVEMAAGSTNRSAFVSSTNTNTIPNGAVSGTDYITATEIKTLYSFTKTLTGGSVYYICSNDTIYIYGISVSV